MDIGIVTNAWITITYLLAYTCLTILITKGLSYKTLRIHYQTVIANVEPCSSLVKSITRNLKRRSQKLSKWNKHEDNKNGRAEVIWS